MSKNVVNCNSVKPLYRVGVNPAIATLGATPEGTVSRRRSGYVDPRRSHCLRCGQRPKGNRGDRSGFSKRT